MFHQIADLDDTPDRIKQKVTALEKQAYEWQLKIFDVRLDIYSEEEQRLRIQVDAIKQELAGTST